MSKETLQRQAEIIRDEIRYEQNTAFRIGKMFLDLIAEMADLSFVGENYLSRIKADSAEELIKFLKGAEFGEFIKSMSAGKGAGIDERGNAQFESIESRTYLKVMEMIFNRLSLMEGEFSYTEAGTVEKVEWTAENTFVLTLRKRWDLDFTAFEEGDVIYGVVNNLLTAGEYYTSWMRVLHKDASANQITVVLYPDSEVPAKKNFLPVEGMNLTRRGNPLNEERQTSWYISSYEGCIVYLDGVTKPIVEQHNYALIIGKLKRLDIFSNLPINYNHPYFYARGLIIQDLFRVDYQGQPIKTVVDRGLWSLETASSDFPYRSTKTEVHEVWNDSCKYRCLVDNTLQEPRWNAPDWLQIAGDNRLTLEFDSSAGYLFLPEQIDSILSAYVFRGSIDITSDIQDKDWEWIRTTDDPVADALWNSQHANFTNRIHITDDDLGMNRLQNRQCTFTCTAFVRDGENVRKESVTNEFPVI